MIDLLIQLRTPKLSKDFKPSIINEILSNSLQPLSDDDLRPMSEAIENIDTMSLNLKTKQEAKQAADKIAQSLDRYNRFSIKSKNLLINIFHVICLTIKNHSAAKKTILKFTLC